MSYTSVSPDIAAAVLANATLRIPLRTTPGYRATINQVPVIYLAGGMKGDWQDQVRKACPGVIFLDPRLSGQPDENGYTAWDLAAVDRCDAILGLMEATNPGGAGLAVEFGWGASAGKHLMFVEQMGYPQQRYFGMVRALADVKETAQTLEQSVAAAITMVLDYKASRALRVPQRKA